MPRIRPEKYVHVVYRTRRFEQMLKWYQTVFDAKVQHYDPAIAFVTYDDEHHHVTGSCYKLLPLSLDRKIDAPPLCDSTSSLIRLRKKINFHHVSPQAKMIAPLFLHCSNAIFIKSTGFKALAPDRRKEGRPLFGLRGNCSDRATSIRTALNG